MKKTEIIAKLESLSQHLHTVALAMLADDMGQKFNAKGVELQGAGSIVSEWIESIKKEIEAEK